MDVSLPVTTISGVGESYATKLTKLNIISVLDLLHHIPFRYEDRTHISTLDTLQPGETATVIGQIESIKNTVTKNKKFIQTAVFSDTHAKVNITWFNQPFLTTSLKPGSKIAVYGKLELFVGKRSFIAPDYEFISNLNFQISDLLHMGRLTPIYPETAGITSKWLRAKLHHLLSRLSPPAIFPDIPTLPDWITALNQIHFPQNYDQVPQAKKRLAQDELLIYQLSGLHRRQTWHIQPNSSAFSIPNDHLEKFISTLPFSLTPSQTQAITEIRQDINTPLAMNRLLEGDVGSGKTVVAAVAAYITAFNQHKTLVLAPTQILAQQHFDTLSKFLSPHNLRISLITGNTKGDISKSDIIVGTHAILNLDLKNLPIGLVVIDEQHRFGVLQRSFTTHFHSPPHVLTMTATPIPRSIALTLYKDLDVSTLSAPPSGRLPIKTWIVPQIKRDSAYTWIKSQLEQHDAQVFIVCPFIEPSETNTTVKAAMQEIEKLRHIFTNYSLALLHGRQKANEKNQILKDFKDKKHHILVATPVVEVGIDIPNATIMLIEDADRFGLAQLHQLRGRVGRGDKQSYCLLFAQKSSPRLEAMQNHTSGRELAEIDLRLRGPGDIYGTNQHGQPVFKIADYSDLQAISDVVNRAQQLYSQLQNYPILRKLTETDKIAQIQPN